MANQLRDAAPCREKAIVNSLQKQASVIDNLTAQISSLQSSLSGVLQLTIEAPTPTKNPPSNQPALIAAIDDNTTKLSRELERLLSIESRLEV